MQLKLFDAQMFNILTNKFIYKGLQMGPSDIQERL